MSRAATCTSSGSTAPSSSGTGFSATGYGATPASATATPPPSAGPRPRPTRPGSTSCSTTPVSSRSSGRSITGRSRPQACSNHRPRPDLPPCRVPGRRERRRSRRLKTVANVMMVRQSGADRDAAQGDAGGLNPEYCDHRAPGRENGVMWAIRRGLAALVIALGLLTAGCSGGEARPATPSATGPEAPRTTASRLAPSSAAAFGAVRVRLVQVTSLQQPVAMAVRPGGRAVYVAEQTGRVRAIRNGRLDPAPVLDISSQIVAGGEQGLLGLAFSPDGRFLYVDFTDRNGDTHETEFAMRGGRADPASG